jgi:hypothetical protein
MTDIKKVIEIGKKLQKPRNECKRPHRVQYTTGPDLGVHDPSFKSTL